MVSNGCDRPVVGISTYVEQARWGVWDREAALLPYVYVSGVHRAGGVPVLLPVLPDSADIAVSTVDALVVAGGADVNPARYRRPAHPALGPVQPRRDAWEEELIRCALRRGTPLLGVCRGAQVLNVALGGTLHQHLPDSVCHRRHQPAPAEFGSTEVRVRPRSRLAAVLGERVAVPCYHHQAIDGVGEGLEVVARAGDGTVEAIELPGHRFAIGVQWHPEQDAVDNRLFAALVVAAKEVRGEHRA